MIIDERPSLEASERRLQAEKQLKAKAPEAGFSRTDDETRHLLHELEVHQIEMEMQNEELRQTQEELEHSRNTYAELFDFAPIGYFVFDASGVIRKVNLAGARLLGIERGLLVNKPLISFIPDADGRGTFSHHLESVLQTQGMHRCEIQLTDKEDAVIYGHLKSVTLNDAGSNSGYILCSIVNGTVGKKLETEIQDAREYAENIVETVREPLVVLNSDLKILTANHSFYNTFKVTPDDTIGNFIYDLGNRQWDIPKLRVLFEEILPHDTVFNGYEVDHDFQGIGRKIILLNARQIFRKNIGSHIILLAMEDITERKLLAENLQNAHDKLELTVQERTRELTSANNQLTQEVEERARAVEALRVSNAYNRSLIEASLDPFVTIAPDGRITDVNKATEMVTGYLREELINADFSDYFTEPEKARVVFQQVFIKGAVRDYPLQIRHRDGHVTPVMYNASVLCSESGELEGVFAAARDISEQKILENQLFQAQKMEAIGQLAGGIAHDFNNMLTAIIGFSSLLEMQMDKADPQKENVNQILAAADRAAELTRSLLAFSRKQIINPKPINLSQVIRNIEKFLQRIIGEDIALKTIYHQDVLTVNADCGQIEQVIMNLAVNARDAMPHGGMLSIELRFVEIGADSIKTHGYGEAGEYALISLSDSGVGMDENTRKRLFEPFFTTKELGKGTGLGLSIVYGIIKQHNGFINVYSEPGVGTTFTIYLPLTKTDISEKTGHVDDILRKGTETLLVADDDAALLDLTEKILVQFGYKVITATDGLDAVTKFNMSKETIALVILDVIMPKMNGKEAFEEIRKICPDIKTIFISGYTADIIHNRGMLDEDLEFLDKPLRPIRLLQKVREVLDRAS
ncbi:MAG: PAS domain S-box protein [Pelobacteraceae bacterium]